jgi:hypothetical protein
LTFDHSKHGYDGALGHCQESEVGQESQRPISVLQDGYLVDVVFFFNGEMTDLEETATEYGLQLQDLFDAFGIVALDKNGNELWEMDYECA